MRDAPDLLEIARDLYRLRIPGGDAHQLNAYIWLGATGVTLFDTGWAHSASLIEAALIELGRKRTDVERVILSHFHEDHAGAAAEISTWSDAEFVAGAKDGPIIRGLLAGPTPYLTRAESAIHAVPNEPPRASPCRVDTEVIDGDLLSIAGEARVLSTPGHTTGSIAVYLPLLDVVLTGDTVAEFNGQVILGVFNVDRQATRRSALAIAATGAGIAGFGHGDPVLIEASARIQIAEDPFADPGASARR